jgi:hypothetical protein
MAVSKKFYTRCQESLPVGKGNKSWSACPSPAIRVLSFSFTWAMALNFGDFAANRHARTNYDPQNSLPLGTDL